MAREDHLTAVYFAAGTAAFMACVERAIVVSVFVHWRVWAFLALNLLLLAILFTSKLQDSSKETRKEDSITSTNAELVEKPIRQERVPELVESPNNEETVKKESEAAKDVGEYESKKEENENVNISKEELNQRVEAFIAMFRQHLISDAKGVKSCRIRRQAKQGLSTSDQLDSSRRFSFSHSKEYIYSC